MPLLQKGAAIPHTTWKIILNAEYGVVMIYRQSFPM